MVENPRISTLIRGFVFADSISFNNLASTFCVPVFQTLPSRRISVRAFSGAAAGCKESY